jgi:hypothetical protein
MNPMRDINKSRGNCPHLTWSGRPSETTPKTKCGSTGWYGKPVACHECEAKYDQESHPYYPEDDYDDGLN